MATETHAERLKKIRDEHEAAMARERAEHAKRMGDTDRHWDERVIEWQESQKLARELERLRQQNSDELTLSSRRHIRGYREALGVELTDEQLEELRIEEEEGAAVHANDPEVVAMRNWLGSVCKQYAIEVCDWRHPAIRQGDARVGRKRITTPPWQSLQTCLIGAHEVGHCVTGTIPDAPSKKTPYGTTICVQEELAAWRWVIDHAPIWDARCHELMTKCLRSYLPHATEDEAFQVKWLTGPSGMCEARLRRLLKEPLNR